MKNLLFLLITIFLFSCGEPTINGKLIDNLNNPIENAKVEIDGTAFTTQTDSKGEYRINFVPGEIKLKYSKENYLDTILKVKISSKDDFPAQTVKTLRVPKTEGIFYVDHENKNYLKLDKSKVTYESRDYAQTLSGYPAMFKIVEYYTTLKEENLIVFKQGKIEFADTSPRYIGLVKLEDMGEGLFKIGYLKYATSVQVDWTHIEYKKPSDGWIRKSINEIETKYASYDERNHKKPFGIRINELSKGYYAFIEYAHKDSGHLININYFLPFKIE